MWWWSKLLPLATATVVLAASGPVEFGLSEWQAANATRRWPIKVKTELSLDPPETFRIEPYTAGGGRVTGGDLRGLMYGLIEAAEQLRSTGRLKRSHGEPVTPLRAVRLVLTPADMDQAWFSSEAFWRTYFQTLARSRFNRFSLAVPRMPEPPTRLRALSQLAAAYGVDFTVALPEPTLDPALLRNRLDAILAACPLIRGIEIDAGAAPLELYREGVLRAIETAGRRVTVDVHNASAREDLSSVLSQEALGANLAVRVSSPSGCKDVTGLPEGSCYWALHEPAIADPEVVRERVPGLSMEGSAGFEIDAPRADGQPPAASDEGLFYWVWGRMSYDPDAPASPPVAPPPAPPRAPSAAKPAVPAGPGKAGTSTSGAPASGTSTSGTTTPGTTTPLNSRAPNTRQ